MKIKMNWQERACIT